VTTKNLVLKVHLIIFVLVMPVAGIAYAQSEAELSTGGTVYVSVYSRIFSGPKGVAVDLTALLSIRNTDPKTPITVLSIKCFDSEGKLIRTLVEKPVKVNPLGSMHQYFNDKDTAGGPGANFIVTWRSQKPVNKPIIESIMSDTGGTLGISFVCPGREITEQSSDAVKTITEEYKEETEHR
jgi:hypothetical protein